MRTDPARTMEKLTEKVVAARARLDDAWHRPDPTPTPSSPSSDAPTVSGDGPSDPVGRAIAAAADRRIRLLLTTIAHTRKLADLIGQLGYQTDAGVAHLDDILDRCDQQRTNFRYQRHGAMRELLAIHRGLWQTLHDTVMAYANDPLKWDEAVSIVDFIANRTEHRLAHQFQRIANRAHLAILQPDHEAAGTNRVACADTHGFGCDRFLPLEQKNGVCRSCESRAYRQRKAKESVNR